MRTPKPLPSALRTISSTTATLAVLAGLAAAQDPGAAVGAEPGDWRMPFRAPSGNVATPEGWSHLRPMYEIAREAAPELHTVDADGREVIRDTTWQVHRDVVDATDVDDGYLSVILRDSMHVSDRAIAFYGGFYARDPQRVLGIIEHIPGEPVRELREDAYRRAAEFVRVQLPQRVPGDVAAWAKTPAGPDGRRAPRPGTYLYAFDPRPFVALLATPDWRDHEQALWFLARCTESRIEFGQAALEVGHALVRRIVATGKDSTRVAVRDFVTLLDPQKDRVLPPDEGTADEWLGWYDTTLHTIFPPLRRISDGRYDLYPSDDLDAVIRLGTAGLQDGTLGTDNVNGQTASGAPFRGFRLEALPAPLDQLGLEYGFTITSINGVPCATAASIAKLLESSAKRARRYVIEFVDRSGAQRAIEYQRR